jgi:ppGpp synthetase/RelA/SpoT-type nucleotidyltranferase
MACAAAQAGSLGRELQIMNVAEINHLGRQLRGRDLTRELLAELDEFRREFQPAIAEVQSILASGTLGQFEPSIWVLRPSKATPSIVSKLVRQPTLNLSQVQDIAGMRLIVHDRPAQDAWAERICSLFNDVKRFDRRIHPSFGYRALHIVVKVLGKPIEIQLRTSLQHAWAHRSEQIADQIGHEFKYGQASNLLFKEMLNLSEDIHQYELRETQSIQHNDGRYTAEIFDLLYGNKNDLLIKIANAKVS